MKRSDGKDLNFFWMNFLCGSDPDFKLNYIFEEVLETSFWDGHQDVFLDRIFRTTIRTGTEYEIKGEKRVFSVSSYKKENFLNHWIYWNHAWNNLMAADKVFCRVRMTKHSIPSIGADVRSEFSRWITLMSSCCGCFMFLVTLVDVFVLFSTLFSSTKSAQHYTRKVEIGSCWCYWKTSTKLKDEEEKGKMRCWVRDARKKNIHFLRCFIMHDDHVTGLKRCVLCITIFILEYRSSGKMRWLTEICFLGAVCRWVDVFGFS